MIDPTDQEFLCVTENIIHGMISEIVCNQGNDKGNGEPNPRAQTRQHLLDPTDMHVVPDHENTVHGKVNSCAFRDALNDMLQSKPITDSFIGSKRHVHSDHIPLSCPVIKSNTDKLLSENDKSFLMFLDDMQNLTIKKNTRGDEMRLPIFHLHCRNGSHQGTTEELSYPVFEQTPAVSNMLTLQALVNSQEYDHLKNYFDPLDCGEDRVTTPEIKLLSSASSEKHQDRQNTDTFQMRLSLNVIPGAYFLEDNLESVLKLDWEKRFAEKFPCNAEGGSNDSSKLPFIFSEENNSFNHLQQFVNGQLQNVYDAVDKNTPDNKDQIPSRMLTGPDIEMARITKKSFSGQMSHACRTHESPSLTECKMDESLDQLGSQFWFDIQGVQAVKLQMEYSSPTESRHDFESTSGNVDQTQCSVRHDTEPFRQNNICKTDYLSARTDNEHPSQNVIRSFEQLAGNNHLQTVDIATDFGKIAVKQTASNNHKGISSTKTAKHPEMSKSKYPEHVVFESDLEDELTVPSECAETGNFKDKVIEGTMPKPESINKFETFHFQHGIPCRPEENPFAKDMTERYSDRLVPDKDRLVPDQSTAFQENCAHSEHEEEQSLYKTERDKLKEARLPSPKFRWKYRPSCDGEDEGLTAPAEEMELVLGNIQPLVTVQCSRSLRIGLSRKQKVKRLHKHVK